MACLFKAKYIKFYKVLGFQNNRFGKRKYMYSKNSNTKQALCSLFER